MKRVNDEYFKIILYSIFGLVLVISSYMIILNVHHYKALSLPVIVNEADTDYINYKKNVIEIESLLNKTKINNETVRSLKNTLTVLKQGGVFRLIPGTKLSFRDLYELNDYFINDIINDCWMTNLNNKGNNLTINILVNNSNYLNRHFIDNGLTLYDSDNGIKIEDDYEMILNNYVSFSNIILAMCKNIGG